MLGRILSQIIALALLILQSLLRIISVKELLTNNNVLIFGVVEHQRRLLYQQW